MVYCRPLQRWWPRAAAPSIRVSVSGVHSDTMNRSWRMPHVPAATTLYCQRIACRARVCFYRRLGLAGPRRAVARRGRKECAVNW